MKNWLSVSSIEKSGTPDRNGISGDLPRPGEFPQRERIKVRGGFALAKTSELWKNESLYWRGFRCLSGRTTI